MFSGYFDLPWWGYVVVTLVLTHITIVSVTVFLHRHQAHRALDLHPAVSHFFRLWLWLTTGMVTKEWTAIHRKHHAKCETEEDPHSPQVYGINRVLWGGVFLYVNESHKKETIEKFGHGTPDDWIERNIYTPWGKYGIILMAVIDVLAFGVIPGMLIFGVQMAWIPFWAAGVINGIGHFWGYRNFHSEDASRNILPWGILIGGEELHNNHHAYATSARLSSKWFEFDIGWMYIRILEMLGLAKVKKLAPKVRFNSAKTYCDFETVQAVITHRYDVLATFGKSLKHTYAEEIRQLKQRAAISRINRAEAKRLLQSNPEALQAQERIQLDEILSRSKVLNTVYSMRQELSALWERSTESKEQLVKRLEDWCRRAETSGITALQEFSQKLRCYA